MISSGATVPTNAVRVSAVIVAYESGDVLNDCVASLADQGVLIETIVVDNGSADGSVTMARRQFPDLVVVDPGGNLGFASGANVGARAASGDLLLFLNPDVRLQPGAVQTLIDAFESPRAAVVGPCIELSQSASSEYGCRIDPLGSPMGLSEPLPPLYVPGCALMTPAAVFDELGGFDDRLFMFVEDVDYCWRALLAGYDVRAAPGAVAWHYGGGSTPGGYPTPEGLSTTRFRVALRERNSLAVLLKCYSATSLAIVLPFYLLQTFATAAALAVRGQWPTSVDVLRGLGWNVRELRRTFRLRRAVQRSRSRREREILARIHPGLLKLSLLRRFGVPSVDEQSTPLNSTVRE